MFDQSLALIEKEELSVKKKNLKVLKLLKEQVRIRKKLLDHNIFFFTLHGKARLLHELIADVRKLIYDDDDSRSVSSLTTSLFL